MLKLTEDEIAMLSGDFKLTRKQVLIGWSTIQDGFKGVNDFSRDIGVDASRGTYIRERFAALHRQKLAAHKELTEPGTKPKQLSRY